MKKGDTKFILNTDKFIISKVKIYDITETHIRVQNIINDDVCPPILPIPMSKSHILFDHYNNAKTSFGSFLYKQYYSTINKSSIVSIGEYGVEMDIDVVNDFIAYTTKHAPEKLI